MTTMSRIDLTNKLFGRLSVLSPAPTIKGRTYWSCLCICGAIINVRTDSLINSHTRSCGCYGRDIAKRTGRSNKIHGHCVGYKDSETYKAWHDMLCRCTDPKNKSYSRYGGRGISVCERWRTFVTFLSDMGEKPTGLTLERIDVDGDYTPNNCRWASIKDQNNNRSTTIMISCFGETKSIKQWSEDIRCSVEYQTLYSRIRIYGWPPEKAITIAKRTL